MVLGDILLWIPGLELAYFLFDCPSSARKVFGGICVSLYTALTEAISLSDAICFTDFCGVAS